MESGRHLNLSAWFNRLLQNPELISGVLSLVGGLLSSPSPPPKTEAAESPPSEPVSATPTEAVQASPPPTEQEGQASPVPSKQAEVPAPASEAIASVGENPLSFLSGLQGILPQNTPSEASATSQTSASEGESVPVMSAAKASRPHKRRDILCAVKPYMNRRRCDMIDRMLHAADLVELFRHT